jgi:hypothetical protein
MAFIQVLAEFFINLILAAIFALINTVLVFVSGKIVKIDDNTILKALACGIYTGVAGLVMAYARLTPLSIALAIGLLPTAKFVYEQEWTSKALYRLWFVWIFLLSVISFGLVSLLSVI